MAKARKNTAAKTIRAKPVIIAAASALAVFGGIIGWMAFDTYENNRIAALKYEFNRFYRNSFDTSEVLDSEGDYDRDGLKNSEERAMNTNGSSADTDSDGIPDGLEAMYGTDPLCADSDGDSILDGIEILAGLDPLSAATDGTPDGQRKFSRTINFEEGSVMLTGGAEIFGATVEKLSLYTVSSNSGAFSFPYEVYCEKPVESARIKFNYNSGFLSAVGIAPDDVHIYKFDPRTKSYEMVGGNANPSADEIRGMISGNGVYLIGAERISHNSAIDENTPINVHLLIDNSGSMYPSISKYASEENDTEFKRLVFARNFVAKLGINTSTAVSAFTYDTTPLCGFTKDKVQSFTAINKIREIGAGYDGTSVERALMRALDGFRDIPVDERNMIVLLTDGISTDKAGYSVDDIANTALARNVTIMTISLGENIDRDFLSSIAKRTGGSYFPISDASALEGLYSTLIATMENDIVDEDEDGTPDSYSLFDTGFISDENGYTFSNFKSAEGTTMDFGMAMLARDWFLHRVDEKGAVGDESHEFDFSQTTIKVDDPLSKVYITSLSSGYMKPDSYLDFLSKGETLTVEKRSFEEAQDMGWITHTEAVPENAGGWRNVEYLVPNYAMGKIRVKYGENDYHMLRAIGWYNTFRDKGRSFVLADESSLSLLKGILAKGEPVLMKMTWEENDEYFSRYVDLTALRRDVDDPNLFHLKIYDVNTESERSVTLNRTFKISGNGKYNGDHTYSAVWSGRRVSVTFYLTETE